MPGETRNAPRKPQESLGEPQENPGKPQDNPREHQEGPGEWLCPSAWGVRSRNRGEPLDFKLIIQTLVLFFNLSFGFP